VLYVIVTSQLLVSVFNKYRTLGENLILNSKMLWLLIL
jgi:hypothetical protein